MDFQQGFYSTTKKDVTMSLASRKEDVMLYNLKDKAMN